MFGLDESVASLSDGGSLVLVVLVALLLGLRHAADPDHLAAVTTLIAGTRRRATRTAAKMGLAWGLGHGTTILVFGLPIVLFGRYLPERAQQIAETIVAGVIVYLAVRLLLRWRRGLLHMHPHEHDGIEHAHLHSHVQSSEHRHEHRQRTALGAYGIGLLHGMGGSAGVGILIVAAVDSTVLSVLSLVVLAVFTAVSMTILTTGFGRVLVSRPVARTFDSVAPALGALSMLFGFWYASAAWSLMPYPF